MFAKSNQVDFPSPCVDEMVRPLHAIFQLLLLHRSAECE